ncbi:MAG: leucine-rich repeat domain-containing protein [Spirochaetaceae bacterium]|nr:leucine-rich repeat domain-containing protein [Spirochaetaceae bacterium]
MDIKEKINAFFDKLPFKALAEKKIPQTTREKFPLLNKAIPWANQIVCGLVLFLFIVVIASGGDSPKSLAKQTHKLSQKTAAAMSDPNKALKLVSKAADLEKKVNKLSAKKKDVYALELGKLFGGGKIPSLGSSGSSSSSKTIVSKLSPLEAQFLPLAERFYGKDLKFWETSATETEATRAAGHIARGKSHIKITGSLSDTQITEIAEAIKNFKNDEKSVQLFRLDLSSVTDLKKIPQEAFRSLNIGSILLPQGLEEIGNSALLNTPLFEANIPSSVKNLGESSFSGTYLTQIIFPVNFQFARQWGEPRAELVFISNIDSNVVFSEGQELANMINIRNTWGEIGAGLGRKLPTMDVIIPASVKTIYCSSSTKPQKEWGEEMPQNIETIYFYGDTPPTVEAGGKNQFFQHVKTIYAPANALKAYEDAYFNITGAKFAALPKDKADISSWNSVKPMDQKNIQKLYGAAAKEGKERAQQRDQEFRDQMKREMQKHGF